MSVPSDVADEINYSFHSVHSNSLDNGLSIYAIVDRRLVFEKILALTRVSDRIDQ